MEIENKEESELRKLGDEASDALKDELERDILYLNDLRAEISYLFKHKKKIDKIVMGPEHLGRFIGIFRDLCRLIPKVKEVITFDGIEIKLDKNIFGYYIKLKTL